MYYWIKNKQIINERFSNYRRIGQNSRIKKKKTKENVVNAIANDEKPVHGFQKTLGNASYANTHETERKTLGKLQNSGENLKFL